MQFVAFNFIVDKQRVHIYGNISIMPEVAAWLIAFTFSFPPGFILSRYIVFPGSNLHGRIQFFRYALTTLTFILMTYILVRLFAIYVPEHPTISYTIVCIITSVLSYISQRKFTFKTIDKEVVPD
jgi:putative flippase GtrA